MAFEFLPFLSQNEHYWSLPEKIRKLPTVPADSFKSQFIHLKLTPLILLVLVFTSLIGVPLIRLAPFRIDQHYIEFLYQR